ncbi:MAG: hypothetical protein HQM02_12210 [Magnetococcales bacterium]|nr:hypothetical protein [Magnetococcales bacterium]
MSSHPQSHHRHGDGYGLQTAHDHHEGGGLELPNEGFGISGGVYGKPFA